MVEEPETADDEPQASTADAQGAKETQDEPQEPTIESLQAELEQAREEIESQRDGALRALADAENVKRRATKDVESARRYALDKFSADLLPVLDSLEKAVDVAGASDQQDTNLQAISEGVSLSLKLFVDTVAKHGLSLDDPLGEPFDPQRHEAIAMVPNPDAEPGSVMDVMQKGYLLNDRVVRAAKVVVVAQPTAAAEPDAGTSEEPSAQT